MIAREWVLIKDTVSGFIEHENFTRGAAIAYYTIFSIAPLLIIVIAIASFVFGHDAAEGAIVGQLSGLVGTQSGEIVQSMIQSENRGMTGIFATIIGVGTLLLTATGVLTEIQSALNAIWKAAPSMGLLELGRARLLSLGLIVTLGFLMLVSLVVSAGVTAFGSYLSDLFPGAQLLVSLLNWTISFLLISLLFAAIYKILPDKPIVWRDVGVGSAVTAILFTIGKSVISLYVGSTGVASGYGAAGALLIMLLWVYYSAQIFFSVPNIRAPTPNDTEAMPPADDCAAKISFRDRRSRQGDRDSVVKAAAGDFRDAVCGAAVATRQPLRFAVPAD